MCGAEYGARSSERTNRRNGYRHRALDTPAGTIDVAILRLTSRAKQHRRGSRSTDAGSSSSGQVTARNPEVAASLAAKVGYLTPDRGRWTGPDLPCPSCLRRSVSGGVNLIQDAVRLALQELIEAAV